MQSVGRYAFSGSGNLTKVTLNKNLKGLDEYAFNRCINLTTVVAMMEEPCLGAGIAFVRIPAACVLYVPVGTRQKYIDAGWTEEVFGGGIIEFDPATAIAGVDADTDKSDSEPWYTIGGTKLTGKPTAAGICIHGGRKVLVK